MLALQKPDPIIQWNATVDSTWMNYFDTHAALRAVVAHIATLPSSKTVEKHTLRVYEGGLKYFLAWLGDNLDALNDHPIVWFAAQPMPLPTEAVMLDFLGHLSIKGLAASTIANKYQIPARHFLKALRKQHITGISGDIRDEIDECRRRIGDAIDVKAPRAEKVSTRSSLYQYGTRLTISQINDVFTLTATDDSLDGKRDLALLYVGITSALRVSELSRITLNSITQADDCYEITVLGKRGQIDPVAIDSTAVRLIRDWINAWNKALDDDHADPRYIDADTPIWQPCRASRPEHPGVNGYLTKHDKNGHIINDGLSRHAIRDIIARRTKASIGIEVNPHDLRRTYAARGVEAGIPVIVISKQLRHQNVATTAKYIGDPPNPGAQVLSNHIQFSIK